MKIVVLIVGALVLAASSVSAQVFTTASRVEWTAPANATTQAAAVGLTYYLRIDGGSPVSLSGVSCTPPAPATGVIQCASTVPAAALPFINVLGMRSATLSAAHPTAGEGPQSSPLELGVRPTAPTGLLVTP